MPRSVHVRTGALVLLGALLLPPDPSFAQDVVRFYEENCSACHTIGGGAQGGPDLAGVTGRVDRAWLIRFMVDPDAVVKSGDPYALKILRENDDSLMPATEGLTPDLAERLLRYIEQQSGAAPGAAPAVVQGEQPPSPEEVEAGRALFVGTTRLARGGPACLGCHHLSGVEGIDGGRLGPDLALTHTRLRGRAGVDAWLANPPTPVMKAVYRRASMDDAERHAFVALFAAVAERKASSAPRRLLDARLAATALGAAALATLAMGFVWRRRFRGVRQPYVDAARRRLPGDQR